MTDEGGRERAVHDDSNQMVVLSPHLRKAWGFMTDDINERLEALEQRVEGLIDDLDERMQRLAAAEDERDRRRDTGYLRARMLELARAGLPNGTAEDLFAEALRLERYVMRPLDDEATPPRVIAGVDPASGRSRVTASFDVPSIEGLVGGFDTFAQALAATGLTPEAYAETEGVPLELVLQWMGASPTATRPPPGNLYQGNLAALGEDPKWVARMRGAGMVDAIWHSNSFVHGDPPFVTLALQGADGAVHRFRLPLPAASIVAASLTDALSRYLRRFQSETSSGMPSRDGSPKDGQTDRPVATASAAAAAVG